MKYFSACLFLATAEAKKFPYSKNYEFLSVPNGKPGVTKNYEMGVTFTVFQETEETDMIFKVLTSIYTASDFVNGNIYQSYVQFEGMSENNNSNIVCNMIYNSKTPKNPAVTVINSCGTTLLYTLTLTKFSSIVGESQTCSKPWKLVPDGSAFTKDPDYNEKRVVNCNFERKFKDEKYPNFKVGVPLNFYTGFN